MAAPSLERCKGIARNRREHSARPKHRPHLGTVGTLRPNGPPRIAVYIGRVCHSKSGRMYEVSLDDDRQPVVTSCTTWSDWTISWDELIDLAVAAGIDREGD